MATAPLRAVLPHLCKLTGSEQMMERTDQQLLQDFLTCHDQASFAALVRRHGAMVLRVCRHVLRHEQDSEDAFQATYLVLARNASSIRKGEALASWLHGVAYRVAMRARRDATRRRTHERQAGAMSPTTSSGDVDWRDMQAVMDEEIQRLPEKYRSSFVLCFLEGMSQSEAARELGLKQGTIWSRLAQARKLLRQRLSRRGVSLSAVLGVAGLVEGTEAVPPSLVASTVRVVSQAVSGRLISAKAAALAEGVSKPMFLTRLKTVTVLCLVAVGAILVGGGLMMKGKADAQPPAPPQQETPRDGLRVEPQSIQGKARTAPPQVALREMGDTIALNGRVLDPDGKPVAGAEITLWGHFGYWGYYRDWHSPTVQEPKPGRGAVSGKDGRFRFTVSKSGIEENPMNMWDDSWRLAQVVATAKGYGPSWARLDGLDKGELTLQLVKEVPIQGRVIDLQGRPVVGARVGVERITPIGQEEFSSLWQPSWATRPESVTTNAKGRFTITGVGRDRTVLLHIEHATIEHKMISASTQADGDGKKHEKAWVELIVEPTKPIEGTVRAKDTGKPLAGVVVYGQEETYHRRVRAVTDRQGRYRLVGLPKRSQYELTVYAPVASGYLSTLS